MNLALISGGFLLGLLGSFHCIGMCGPIALALPLPDHSLGSRIWGSLLYNAGRILTYSILGLIFGILGYGIVVSGFQQLLSITVGAVVLTIALVPYIYKGRAAFAPALTRWVSKLKNMFGFLFKRKSYGILFLIGTLNGLLPCGLVYLGIAGAIATGDGIQGALFMAAFGFGTFPVMLSLPLIKNSIGSAIRTKIRTLMPFFVIVMGLLLILRGLNLGIPYLSPKLSSDVPECHQCCHK